MADFNTAFQRTVGLEGKYSNDPGDSGGETMYGITIAEARRHGYDGQMKDMPLSFAKDIYLSDYWQKLKCGEINHQAIANELFDSAVNCGVLNAGTWLQKALNLFNKCGKLYPDISEDGVVGSTTISTLKAAMAVTPWYPGIIVKALDSQQGAYYMGISRSRQELEKFDPGWFRNRIGEAS